MVFIANTIKLLGYFNIHNTQGITRIHLSNKRNPAVTANPPVKLKYSPPHSCHMLLNSFKYLEINHVRNAHKPYLDLEASCCVQNCLFKNTFIPG